MLMIVIRIMLTINLKITVASALASGITTIIVFFFAIVHYPGCQCDIFFGFLFGVKDLHRGHLRFHPELCLRTLRLGMGKMVKDGQNLRDLWILERGMKTHDLLPWNQTAMNLICSPDEATLLFLPVIWGFVGIWPFAKNSWHQFCTSGWFFSVDI